MVIPVAENKAQVHERLRRIRDRHFDCFFDLARSAWEETDQGDKWFPALEAELANIRSALTWGLERERTATAAFAAYLGWYWVRSRRFVEGRQMVERVLRLPDLPPTVRTDALYVAGMLAWEQGDVAGARERYASARALAISEGDSDRQARAAIGLGWSLFHLNLGAPAAESFAEALEVGTSLTPTERADANCGLGWARSLEAGYLAALGPHREARRVLEAASDPRLVTHYLVETNLLLRAGHLDEAMKLADEALALARSGRGSAIFAWEAKAKVVEAIGDAQGLRTVIDEGIRASAEAAEPKWEAHFRWRLAVEAVNRGEVDEARVELDHAIRLLDQIETLNMSDMGIRAHVLMTLARLLQDDGVLEVAEELLRQAIRCYSSSPRSHADALAVLGRFFAAHGDFDSAYGTVSAAAEVLAPTPRPLGTLPRLGIDGGLATYGEMDLARTDAELDAVLRHLSGLIAEAPVRQPMGLPGLLCRRAEILGEQGRSDDALEDLDRAVATSASGSPDWVRSHRERARLRIATGNAEGARSDLVAVAAAALVGWSDDQLHLAATLARLALLEDRSGTAAALWSAVLDYRAANRRLPPRLARRFEEPLYELRADFTPSGLPSRAALQSLRTVVAEEIAALAAAEVT